MDGILGSESEAADLLIIEDDNGYEDMETPTIKRFYKKNVYF